MKRNTKTKSVGLKIIDSKEKAIFDEDRNLWVYKISSNGLTVYGYGETEEDAKKDFEKNCEEMWEW